MVRGIAIFAVYLLDRIAAKSGQQQHSSSRTAAGPQQDRMTGRQIDSEGITYSPQAYGLHRTKGLLTVI